MPTTHNTPHHRTPPHPATTPIHRTTPHPTPPRRNQPDKNHTKPQPTEPKPPESHPTASSTTSLSSKPTDLTGGDLTAVPVMGSLHATVPHRRAAPRRCRLGASVQAGLREALGWSPPPPGRAHATGKTPDRSHPPPDRISRATAPSLFTVATSSLCRSSLSNADRKLHRVSAIPAALDLASPAPPPSLSFPFLASRLRPQSPWFHTLKDKEVHCISTQIRVPRRTP